MLASPLLAASRSPGLRNLVTTVPASRHLVDRFVAGDGVEHALAAAKELAGNGLAVTLDHLGEDTLDATQATATRDAYVLLLDRLADAGLAERAEVSIKLSALGRALPLDGRRIALHNTVAICEAARRAGTTVTVDMEDHTTVDATLEIVRALRPDFPWLGAVLQSGLRRTEADCAELAGAGSRVRLVKGAYAEPPSVAFETKREVDLAYVRCLRILFEGSGYPMVATHDPRMIAITQAIATQLNREPHTFEYQLLYGIRGTEQRRLATAGQQVRVYVPYGSDWYAYFMRRLAERPANVGFFLRSLFTR